MLITLIGFRGSGKTSVGKVLADRLGLKLLDMDSEIERREGRTIAEIFEAGGEETFRMIEGKLAEEISTEARLVVAAGGGIVTNSAAVATLLQRSFVIYLDAPSALLCERITSDPSTITKRPPLTGAGDAAAEVEALLEARSALYNAFADATIFVGEKTPEQIADEITPLTEEMK